MEDAGTGAPACLHLQLELVIIVGRDARSVMPAASGTARAGRGRLQREPRASTAPLASANSAINTCQ